MIEKLLALIPSEYKIIAIVAACAALVAAVGAGFWYVEHRGYLRCEASHATAQARAQAAAQKEVTNVEKHYAPIIQKLQDAPDSNATVGPLTTRAIDGLR